MNTSSCGCNGDGYEGLCCDCASELQAEVAQALVQVGALHAIARTIFSSHRCPFCDEPAGYHLSGCILKGVVEETAAAARVHDEAIIRLAVNVARGPLKGEPLAEVVLNILGPGDDEICTEGRTASAAQPPASPVAGKAPSTATSTPSPDMSAGEGLTAKDALRHALAYGVPGPDQVERLIADYNESVCRPLVELLGTLASERDALTSKLAEVVSALRVGVEEDMGVPAAEQTGEPVDLVLAYSTALKHAQGDRDEALFGAGAIELATERDEARAESNDAHRRLGVVLESSSNALYFDDASDYATALWAVMVAAAPLYGAHFESAGRPGRHLGTAEAAGIVCENLDRLRHPRRRPQ